MRRMVKIGAGVSLGALAGALLPAAAFAADELVVTSERRAQNVSDVPEAIAGDNVGVLLRGVEKSQIERGMVICAPGSIKPHTEFECQAYILSKDEGGRHTPFFSGYRPQFYFRTTDVTGACDLMGGAEMVMPGDTVKLSVKLGKPIAMEEGAKFAIREGGRTVGAGNVTKVIK